MMNGITYYRLKSDYPGDYTKNCALNGTEVDNNFYVLEGRDVKSISVNEKDLEITLLNGEVLSAKNALDFVKPEEIVNSVVNVDFDKENGVLTITDSLGNVQNFDGFVTKIEESEIKVATDNTLKGNGVKNSPLSVSNAAKTGQYKSVKEIICIADGCALPQCGNVIGDRYLTCENISDYGYLYDYKAIREIACEIKNTGWRIPTKEDWDDLLNSVEPCKHDKDHGKADKNRFLGKWAGKLLKSKTMWKDCGCSCECEDTCYEYEHNDDSVCFDFTDNECVGTKECESSTKCGCCDEGHDGLDAYGFRITPTGYADDGCNYEFFKERSAFWTATTDVNSTKAYIKRFQYNKDNVYQDVLPGNYHLSLRLVKDYDGQNFYDTEEILDMNYPTLLMPSDKNGKSIWTSCNVSCGNASLHPMLPNNGQGITFTKHYFINEWDGHKWLRNEVKNGESVVVECAKKGKKMLEYRLIGDKLVSVNEMVFKDVMDEVEPILDEMDTRLNERINLVEESVVAEREERVSGDTQLWDALNQEAAAREEVDNQQWEAITKEAEAREEVDNQQWEAINNESRLREEIDNQQWDAINDLRGQSSDIAGKLPTQEGTKYDNETGELLLKSADGTNDITVQFSFNFGEF